MLTLTPVQIVTPEIIFKILLKLTQRKLVFKWNNYLFAHGAGVVAGVGITPSRRHRRIYRAHKDYSLCSPGTQ